MNSCFGNKNTTKNEMDAANKKMLDIMLKQSPAEGAKQMIEDCGGDYAAMRAKYG